MTHYSLEPRTKMYVKVWGFFVILKKSIYQIREKKLDAATKIGLGALKNVSKNVVHKAPEDKSHHHVKVGFFEDD